MEGKKIIDDVEVVAKEFTTTFLDEFNEVNRKLAYEIRKLGKVMKSLHCYLRGGKRSRYYHTGIEPKRQNRIRKKQRLTRLQRRWKRQKR